MTGTRSLKVRPHALSAGLLVKARRAKKLTLAQAALETKLPLAHLSALESGDFSVFAAEVYGRGAYLAYARYLGLNEGVAQRQVAQALLAARERVPLKVFTPFRWVERFVSGRSVLWAGIAAIGLGVGGYIIWQVQSFVRLPALVLTEPAGVILAGPEMVVRGATEVKARVTVNGEPALLTPEGEFSLTLWLRPGVNVVRVEAQNAAGRVRTVEKHLLLLRS